MNVVKSRSNQVLQLIVFVVCAVILFIPVLTKYFVSDDFIVLNRVCLDNIILTKGFFRPLSDITIYGNYLLGGFNPLGFNLVNIIIHGTNSFLFYQFCLKWKWPENERLQYIYATTASILFLTYPFHNESVVWLLGRGSLLAGTFGIAAMLIVVSGWTENKKILGACICYFVGLMAYESIIMLPVILMIFLLNRRIVFRQYIKWMLFLFITLGFHFFMRIYVSGSILGSYGGGLIKIISLDYAYNIFKVAGRLIIPPMQNSNALTVIFAFVTLILAFAFFITFRKCGKDTTQKNHLLTLLGILACTLIIPLLFNVSTKTSESDRFLYFPSFFLCSIISFLIVKLVTAEIHWRIMFVMVCIYNIIFLEYNNLNWLKAARATERILQVIKNDTSGKKLFIANLPNEFDGAFVFRLGFKQALLINKVDTSRQVILNILSREEYLDLPEIIKPVYSKNSVFIPPVVKLNLSESGADDVVEVKGAIYSIPKTLSTLYYWNKKQLTGLK